MSGTGRAFVAVVPPPGVLDAVERAVGGLRGEPAGARWTRRDQLHVTLQFLGDHVDLGAIADALAPLALQRGVARLGGAGAFPDEGRGRVLWVGLTEGREHLTRLAAAVDVLLGPLGYAPEDRPFHAHLTLARLRRPADLRAVVAALDAQPFGPAWPVEEVVLYRSDTRPDGAVYEPCCRVRLPG